MSLIFQIVDCVIRQAGEDLAVFGPAFSRRYVADCYALERADLGVVGWAAKTAPIAQKMAN